MILAAGGATRWEAGSDGSAHKLLAPFRGRPLVQWAVQHAVDAALDETWVVTGAVDLSGLLPPDIQVIANPAWAEGQAGSLRQAVTRARGADVGAIVVGLGDQPLIPPSAWRAVAASTAPIAVATYGGRRRNPVRLAAAVWDLLPETGDEGARGVIHSRPDLVQEVPCSGEPVDIDTREDLQRWS